MIAQFDSDIPTVPLISIIYREHAKYINEKVKDKKLSSGLIPLLIKIYENEGIIQNPQVPHRRNQSIRFFLIKLIT